MRDKMKKILTLITIMVLALASAGQAEWVPYTIHNSPLETNNISSLEISPDGQILIGSQGRGLFAKSDSDWRVLNSNNTGQPINYAYSIAYDANALFIGSASGNLDSQPLGEGLSKMNLSDSAWSAANQGLEISSIITGIEVTPAYRAVSTYGGGVTLFGDEGWIRYRNEYRTEYTYADNQQQTFKVNPGTYLPTDYIKGIDYDSQNDILWIATLSGGAVAYTGGIWQTYDLSNSGLPSNRIQLIKADPDNSSVYFGTFGFGLARMTGDQWTVFNTANSPLVANYIYSMEIRPDNGDLWIGTNYALSVVAPDGEWSSYTAPDSNLVWGAFYSDIAFDSSGNVWVSTFGGGIASMALEIEPEPEEDSLYVDVKHLKFLLREPRRHNVAWLKTDLAPAVDLQAQDSVSIKITSETGLVYNWESLFGDFHRIFHWWHMDIYCTYFDGSMVFLKYQHNQDKIKLTLLDWQPEINQDNMAYELDVRVKLGSYVGHDQALIGPANPACDPEVVTLDVDQDDLLLATGYYPVVTDIDDDNPAPQVFSLPVNYPNPFNANTTIAFGLDHSAHVQFAVFDILGRTVSVTEAYFEAGPNKFDWDGTGKGSGVYYYSIRVDETIYTGSMTLLK